MTVFSAMRSYASANGNSLSDLRLFAFEGDSRSTLATYPSLWTPSPVAVGITKAVSASGMADLNSRITAMTDMPVGKVSGQRFYAVVGPMGANDLHTTPGATDAIAAAAYAAIVATYCDALYTAGFDEVVLCTELATTNATHDARRALLNDIYRSSYPGANPVTICDFAADPVMGTDTAFADAPGNWTDALHPNVAGNTILAGVLAPVLNALA